MFLGQQGGPFLELQFYNVYGKRKNLASKNDMLCRWKTYNFCTGNGRRKKIMQKLKKISPSITCFSSKADAQSMLHIRGAGFDYRPFSCLKCVRRQKERPSYNFLLLISWSWIFLLPLKEIRVPLWFTVTFRHRHILECSAKGSAQHVPHGTAGICGTMQGRIELSV